MVGAEADAELAQARAGLLVERLDLLGELGALQHALALDEAEGDAAGRTRKLDAGEQLEQRLQQRLDMALQPDVDAVLHALARRAGQALIGEQDQARAQRVVGRDDPCHRRAEPAQRAVGRQQEFGIGRIADLLGAAFDLAGKRLLRHGADRLGVRSVGLGIWREAETLQASDMLSLDQHIAGGRDFCFEHRVFSEPLHQHTGPTIHETLCQPFVQRIGQPILYRARALLPMAWIR